MSKLSIKLRQCLFCEKLFYAPKLSRKGFCSKECQKHQTALQTRKWWRIGRKSLIRRCPICETEFAKKGTKKYCSPVCALKGYRRACLRSELKQKRYLQIMGINNPVGSGKLIKQLREIEKLKEIIS